MALIDGAKADPLAKSLRLRVWVYLLLLAIVGLPIALLVGLGVLLADSRATVVTPNTCGLSLIALLGNLASWLAMLDGKRLLGVLHILLVVFILLVLISHNLQQN